jgi:hypothetical protein
MPWKLPAPDEGTDEHAAPNGAAMADELGMAEDGPLDGAAAAADELDAELPDPVEPQAAAPSAMLAESAATAANVYFMETPSC